MPEYEYGYEGHDEYIDRITPTGWWLETQEKDNYAGAR